MTLRNSETTYGSITKFLHWIVLFLVLVMLSGGAMMGYFPKSLKPLVYNTHKLVGLVVLTLAIIFCLWSIFNTKPLYFNMKKWERKLARYVHFLLYACLLAMPLSGWIMASAAGKYPSLFSVNFAMPWIPLSKSLAGIANKTHEILAWVFLGLIILHILGALKHHFIDRSDILTRMMKTHSSNTI